MVDTEPHKTKRGVLLQKSTTTTMTKTSKLNLNAKPFTPSFDGGGSNTPTNEDTMDDINSEVNKNNKTTMTFSGTSESSQKEWFTFLLVFQKWTADENDRDCVIPPDFALNLRKYLLEPQFSLNLPNTFHFRTLGRPESSRHNTIYEFSLPAEANNDMVQRQGEASIGRRTENDPNDMLLRVRCVRKWDNDVHTIDLDSKEVTSKVSHYMSGSRKSTMRWKPERTAHGVNQDDWSSASHVLCRQWIAPDRWIENRRFLLLRPKEVETRHRRMICKTANEFLDQGYSMLLFLCREVVPVPLVANEKLSIAGMLWRDAHGKKLEDKDVPDGFALIVAEGMSDDDTRTNRFQNDLFVWRRHHVYNYHHGRWA